MAATMSSVATILKEIYEPTMREQLNAEVTTLTRVQKTSEGVTSEVGGRYVTFPVKTSRNQGIGARLEMEALPAAGNQGRKTARVGLRHLYGTMRLTGQVFELAKTNTQAFASTLEDETTSLKTDLAVDLNRQVYGNGTGTLAAITAGTTGTTFTVAHTLWLDSQIGCVVDIYDATGVTQKATGRTITTITDTQVTISGANVTVVSTDIIVRTGSVGKADLSVQREWTGLGAIVSSIGTLYNLTDPVWTSNLFTNSGTARALSEGLMTTACDVARKRGGSTPSVMFCNLGVRRSYANLLVQQRRFTNVQEFKGGFSGLAFTTDKGDVPLVTDTHCPPNSIYGLNEKELKWYRAADWEFMNRDNSTWDRVPGYDAYDATMYQYSELGTHRRNAHFFIGDIIES